jgi:transmembrane sensor
MAATVDDAVVRDAARWFTRMANAPADHPDRGRFEAWLVSSPRHAAEYARFSEVWDDFDSNDRLERLTFAVEDSRAKEEERKREQARRRRGAIKVFAALGIGAALGWRFLSGKQDTPSLVIARSAARRQPLEQALPDGSRLSMAPDSQLELRYFADRREVLLLRGETLFEVARDERRPFVVSSAQARVTVIGTRFVVHRLPEDGVRVSVLEGRVRVEPSAGKAAPLQLSAGDVVELDRQGSLRRVSRNARDASAWQEGRLVFDADTLPEVVERLSRFSRQPVSTATGPAGSRGVRITAVVQLRDVDAFIRSLPKLAPVRLREEGGVTVVEPITASTPVR